MAASGFIFGTSQADIVQADDVIIQFSLCVGNDCVNGENFGFDTVRLKENNLRIHFDDTSTTASFPSNDWRITINDTSNGGANFFAIEDATGGRIPFRIEAGAPANALHVDDSGRIGVGTSTPVVGLHVVDGNSPTLRLEQDGSAGFTPQIFDVAANEANFFIRDATNGSRLIFRAQPGAPENSIYIANSGNIGFGTNSPQSNIHVIGTRLELESRTPGEIPAFELNEPGSTLPGGLALQNDQLLLLHEDGDAEFSLDTSGNVRITGTITTSGSCSNGCDAVFDPEYPLPTIEEHAQAMFENRYLPVVGPTQTGPINLSDKTTAMLNELEKAHIYIAQINEEKKALKQRLDQTEERLLRLEEHLTR